MSNLLKKTNNKQTKFPSELRFDIASKNWVVIATGRAKRPEVFKNEKKQRARSLKKDCPFCKIETQKIPVLILSNNKKAFLGLNGEIPKNWTTIIIPNKYPAFLPENKLEEQTEGNLYKIVNAVGFHEIIITKDHDAHLALLPVEKVKEVINAYQTRYLELISKPFVNHIAIFHNHGKTAGASIYHPHSQLITTPLVDTDLNTALLTSKNYFKKHKKCIYCEMSKLERKLKKRIVFENKDFLAICPFASKMAFQVIISPKKHLPYFEKITEKEKASLAEAFKMVLHKIYKGLNNPDYNFYLHTAPCDGKDYSFYHWHWTILPKTSIHAGFELGAQMEISTIEPEKAAEYLRTQ
ncbi:MAG: galactose-1-phosphate uridylyltransferase [Candidatus Pacebacteria bacterium]|nr:galactose-1-phosphate uridylyltransferase [Candidatus Paceibacterota bacterium]